MRWRRMRWMRRRLPLAPRVIGAAASIIFVALTVADGASDPPPIVPLHVKVHLSRAALSRVWSTDVYYSSGKKAYVLWLEPEYTTHNDLVGVDLVLNKGEYRDPDADNLLAPIENWHGLQSFMFGAGDLTRGPDKTVYGAGRIYSAREGGLVVRVKILGAKVSEAIESYRLDELDLSISVENGRGGAH